MRKPRILFLVPSLARAGAEKQVVELANGLAAEGFECHVASFEPNQDQLDRLDRERVDYHPLQRRWKFDMGIVADLARIIDEKQIDVLHCTLSISVFYGMFAAGKAKRRPAVVAGIHTTLSRTLKGELLERSLYRWQLRSADRVVFVCHRQMEHWIKRDSRLAPRSTVIYNGVDHLEFDRPQVTHQTDRLRNELGLSQGDPAICCVAAFRPEKAQGNIVRALAKLPAAHRNVHLLLAGQGTGQKDVEALVAELGLAARVHFLGKLSDVRPVFAASVFSVISSVAVETFSFSMLESMSMGTPVCSSRIGGAAEAVIPGETGELVTPGSVEDLARAMGSLLEDPEETRRYGESARAMVQEKFSSSKMITETAAMLLEVFSQHSAK